MSESARGHIVVRRKAKDGHDGQDGHDGVGVSFVTISYATSDSATRTPTEGWQSIMPEIIDNYYLWTRTVITYTDGTTSTSYSVARSGKGISTVIVEYAASASGTTPPTSGWQLNIPVVAAGSYLWTRTTTNYTDSSRTVSYSISRNGTNGANGQDGAPGRDGQDGQDGRDGQDGAPGRDGQDGDTPVIGANGHWWINGQDTGKVAIPSNGVGISSIVEYYAISNSTTAPADSAFSTSVVNPTASKPYLWNYEKINYTDGSSTKTSKAIIGTRGSNGTNGTDGVGIANVVEYYAISNSTTAPADSAFSTSVVTPTASKPYLWNYEVITYTNGNTTKTSKAIIGIRGSNGSKGDTGDTGPRGYSGCVYRITVWESGKEYRNDSALQTDNLKYVDIAVDVPMAVVGTQVYHAYMCKVTHTSSSSKPLGHSTYWTEMTSMAPMITPLLLASAISADYINVGEIAANASFIQVLTAQQAFIDNAVIRILKTAETGKRIIIQNNQMTMFDANNRQKLLIKGEDIDIGTPSASYPTDHVSISQTYQQQGQGGQDQGTMTICRFQVNAANTQVVIPRLTIEGSVQQGYYGGDIYNNVTSITLYKDGSFYSQLATSRSTWGDCTYGGATFNLQPGTYTIVVSASWEWWVDSEQPYWNWITFTLANTSTGNILVASGTEQSIQIGANGVAIHLGNAFSAVFALDSNSKPQIMMQGINSSSQPIGLKITSSGVQINRGSGWVNL